MEEVEVNEGGVNGDYDESSSLLGRESFMDHTVQYPLSQMDDSDSGRESIPLILIDPTCFDNPVVPRSSDVSVMTSVMFDRGSFGSDMVLSGDIERNGEGFSLTIENTSERRDFEMKDAFGWPVYNPHAVCPTIQMPVLGVRCQVYRLSGGMGDSWSKRVGNGPVFERNALVGNNSVLFREIKTEHFPCPSDFLLRDYCVTSNVLPFTTRDFVVEERFRMVSKTTLFHVPTSALSECLTNLLSIDEVFRQLCREFACGPLLLIQREKAYWHIWVVSPVLV